MSRGADNCMVPFAILSVDSQIKFIDWNYTTFDSVNGVHCFIFFYLSELFNYVPSNARSYKTNIRQIIPADNRFPS